MVSVTNGLELSPGEYMYSGKFTNGYMNLDVTAPFTIDYIVLPDPEFINNDSIELVENILSSEIDLEP